MTFRPPHEQVKVVTAIQCAGNRREDMTKVKTVKGLGWSVGAVSNCEWTGVRLRDVLKHAGLDVDDPSGVGVEHVQFEGEDRREGGSGGARGRTAHVGCLGW